MDDDVAIKVAMEVSSIIDQIKTPAGSTAYRIGTRTANTVLRLKNGETQVLAGLINDEERRSGNRLPGAGEIPVLGRLFGNGTDDNQKTEIVLSITPHLIRNIQRPASVDAEFQAGTENNLRNRPDMRPTSLQEPAAAPIGVAPGAIPIAPATAPSTAGQAGSASAIADPNAALQILWLGPTQVKVGENVSIAVNLRSNQAIAEIPLTLGYDSKQLQLINVAEGEFLKRGNAATSFKTQQGPDQIVISSSRVNGSAEVSAGNLAFVTFRALAPTDATLVKVMSVAALGSGKRNIGPIAFLPYNLKITP